jgi:hypothetical protein
VKSKVMKSIDKLNAYVSMIIKRANEESTRCRTCKMTIDYLAVVLFLTKLKLPL